MKQGIYLPKGSLPDDPLCCAQLISTLPALFMCNYIEDIVAEAIEVFQYSGHSKGIPPIIFG